MRVCKAIHHATLSPYWMRAIKMPGMLAQAAMLMSLPLSLIVALGQVQPLVAYWGISRVQLALWWPVLVAVVALLQLLVARALVTTYLSLGLYQVRQGSLLCASSHKQL